MASTVSAYAARMTEARNSEELDFAGASQALAGLDRLDVPAMELMYKLECSGEDFSNLLADRIGNEEAATLLRRDAKEELGHAQAGDAGYQGWADHEPDPQVARLLRLNGREETLHGERVTQAIAILESSTSS
jgi:hypothetical protein